MRRPPRLLSIGLIAATAIAAAGCSANTGQNDQAGSQVGTVVKATLAPDSNGPAPAVPGAVRGGTVTGYESGDFEHLDPQRNYVIPATVTGTHLLYRTLTMFREDASGRYEVVGDLATNTGESSNGGKTWTFHLKDGLKYEDGTPITAQDVAYGIARSFSPALSEGPHYWAQWLAGTNDFNSVYKGPYDGAALLPPNTTTPDAKTIVFNFPQPHADTPFAATLVTTSPVPKAKDTKAEYDNHPVASGPYKIQTYTRSQKLVLVRNANWDPKTDPARHDYPDSYVIDFTRTAEQATELIRADRDADASAFTYEDMAIPTAAYPKVIAEPTAKSRILSGPTIFVWSLDFNTQRVTDIKIRQALNYALDRQGVLKVWGSYLGQPATTILSTTTSGFVKYNAYDGGPNGNIAKAKELLGGKTVKLLYGYRNTPRNQQVAAFLKSSLAPAGFDLTIQPIDKDQYYTQIGKKNNPFDLYLYGWGADWPGGNTIIPPRFDGSAITPEGNSNTTYLNDPGINDEIHAIQKLSDLAQADARWAELDKKIMTNFAPSVPAIYDVQATLNGSKLGGIYLSKAYGNIGLTDLFVKTS